VLDRLKQVNYPNINEWIGPVKITPTRITGGTANNMAPEEIRITVDIRTIPESTTESIVELIQRAVPECEVVIRSSRFRSVATSSDTSIAQLCRKLSGNDFFGSPTCSDWAFLEEWDIIKIGPGNSEQSHTADESIEIDQLEKGVAFYKRLMMEF
jgi:acetylornithine deacetylase